MPDLIVMGELSLGDAETKFIEDLAESIPSPDVLKEIVSVATELMTTDLKQTIIDIGMDALTQFADANGFKIESK
jgi:hypothetical protein